MGVDEKISGVIMAILVVLVIAGGFSRVTKVMDLMVPVMAILYMVGAFVIIFMNADQILPALGSIFVYAFTPHAAVGGFAGSTIALALRWGSCQGSILQRGGLWYCAYGTCFCDSRSPYQAGSMGAYSK